MKVVFGFLFFYVVGIIAAKQYSLTPRYSCQDDDYVLQGRKCVKNRFLLPTIRCQLELGDLLEISSFRKDCSQLNINDNQRHYFLMRFLKNIDCGLLKKLDFELFKNLDLDLFMKDGFNINLLNSLDFGLLENSLKNLDCNSVGSLFTHDGLNSNFLKNLDSSLLKDNALGRFNSINDILLNLVENSTSKLNLLVTRLTDSLNRQHGSNFCFFGNCLGGTTFKNNQCVSVDTVNPKIICGNASSLVGDKCTTVATPKRICPPNFLPALSKNGIDKCIGPTGYDKFSKCPKNYVPKNGRCYLKKLSVPVLKCPTGYELLHTFCFLLEKSLIRKPLTGKQWSLPRRIKPEVVCSDGAQMRNKRCEINNVLPMRNYSKMPLANKIVKPLISCDKGYTLKDTICIKIDVAVQKCPANYKLENKKCRREDFYSPVLQCPQNFQFFDNKCVFTKETDAVLNCPAFFKMRNNKCVLF